VQNAASVVGYLRECKRVSSALTEHEPEKLKLLMETVMNTLMKIEREAHIGASSYEHTCDRNGHANGYKPRGIKTQRFGSLELLHPQMQIDELISAWRSEEIDEAMPYLYVDATYKNVREGARIVSKGALIVTGVASSGKRRILDFLVDDTESEASSWIFSADLKIVVYAESGM